MKLDAARCEPSIKSDVVFTPELLHSSIRIKVIAAWAIRQTFLENSSRGKVGRKRECSRFQLAMVMITFGGSSLGKQGATVGIERGIERSPLIQKNLKLDQNQ